jgi:hypothetical protein
MTVFFLKYTLFDKDKNRILFSNVKKGSSQQFPHLGGAARKRRKGIRFRSSGGASLRQPAEPRGARKCDLTRSAPSLMGGKFHGNSGTGQ